MLKVLLVDDSPLVLDFLKTAVQTREFEVKTARNGQEGLIKAKTWDPDIIFADIFMPKLDGLDLLSAIREDNLDTIIIMITGSGNEDLTIEAIRRHANDFLKKPITTNVLFPLLDKYSDLINERNLFHKTRDFFVNQTFLLEIDSDFDLIPPIVERLISETKGFLPNKQKLGIKLGLLELLVNAVEHGNLEITQEEKENALEAGYSVYENLKKERLANKTLANRKVKITFTMDQKHCHWEITDEGNGFDFADLPDPTLPQNLMSNCGRGIFLAKMNFDSIHYLEKGNIVKVEVALNEK